MSIDTSKIIHGVVGGGRYTVTSPIVKEDYGLYLLIEGLELPSTYEVDFSNSEHNGTSVTMIGNSDGVLIPSQFISSGKDVFAFLYHVGADFGRTVYKFRIPNKVRPDRTDAQPTPEEQDIIDQAISALNTAVAQTAQDVIDADQSKRTALTYAESAQESARQAQEYSTVAISNANSASQSASQASASATASANSASQSAQIKTDVQGLVSDAQGYAQSASQSATASANSASQASASATSASQSATSAQGYASQAQTSAQTASSKASEASTSASTASAKATESANSASLASGYATQAESAKTSAQTAQGLAESARDSAQGYANDAQGYANDAQTSAESVSASASQIAQNTADILKAFPTDTASGSIASFSDGADGIPLKSLVVDINPVQDLHGYDSPWVGGGGVNKFKFVGNGYVGTNGNIASPTNLVNGYSEYVPVKSGDNIWITGTFTSCVFAFYDSEKGFLSRYTSSSGTASEDGYIRISVNLDNSTSVTSESCVTNQIQLAISATMPTEYYPYENICPISGWEGMQLQKTRANILNPSANPIWDGSNVYTINQDGSVTQSSGDGRGWTANTFTGLFLKKGQYTLSFTAPNITCNLRTSIDDYTENYRTTKSVLNFTLTEDCTVKWKTNVSSYPVTYAVQLEVGTEATDYEPYNGTTLPISWQSEAGTVYGGKLDVLSGKLRVEKALLTLDGTNHGIKSVSVSGATGNYFCTIGITGAKLATAELLSNMLKYTGVNITTIGNIYYANATNLVIILADQTLTTAAQVNTWLADHNIQIVYSLATPIEIQLDGHTINSLYGTNNIFADTGDTLCEYRADTRLYIEKLTQPEEDDMIADSAIASGQFFMIGNSLYKALTAIASGATITVGTNAQRVSLSDALNLVNT